VSARRTLVTRDIDLRATMKTIGTYPRDPTTRWTTDSFTKAVLTPAGSGTMQLTWDRSGHTAAEAWGSGADWLLDRAPHWVGLHDDIGGFDPTHNARVAEWWRRHPGLRLAAAGVIWQELLLVLLGQRVTTEEALKSWVRIVYEWRAGPGPVRPPTASDAGGRCIEVVRRPAPIQCRPPTCRCHPARCQTSQPIGGGNDDEHARRVDSTHGPPRDGCMDGDIRDHRQPR